MEKQETGLLDQAIEGVERLIVRHCELVDAALCMSAQVQAAPACGRIEVLEDMKEGAMDQAVRNISRLTVDLERLKRMRERDEVPGTVLEMSGEDMRLPVVIQDKETKTLILSTVDGTYTMRLKKQEAEVVGQVLIDQSRRL